jgi:hypothetical protein
MGGTCDSLGEKINPHRILEGNRKTEEHLGRLSGGTVVKVLCYKSGGHWFDSRWCHWNFSLT